MAHALWAASSIHILGEHFTTHRYIYRDYVIYTFDCRLLGIPNIRIVDASVLPRPISGNPNTVISAIALRAASWILKNELLEGTEH